MISFDVAMAAAAVDVDVRAQKRPKLEEEDEEARRWAKHLQEREESEGFDIETFLDAVGAADPVDFDFGTSTHPLTTLGCILSVIYAVAQENRSKNMRLVPKKIIKSYAVGVLTYYTTFIADDEGTGESKIYQTRIYFPLITPNFGVEIFRERPSQDCSEVTGEGCDLRALPSFEHPRPVIFDLNKEGIDVALETMCLEGCTLALRHALREEHVKKENYIVHRRIIHATYESNILYRITFLASDPVTEEIKVYDAQVFLHMDTAECEVQMLKPREGPLNLIGTNCDPELPDGCFLLNDS